LGHPLVAYAGLDCPRGITHGDFPAQTVGVEGASTAGSGSGQPSP
jgi:hypothetical protein